MKNPWVVVGIIMVVLFGGAIWYSSIATEKSNEGVVAMEHIKGNKDATVTLVEYSDFQCPACASFQPVVKEILASYGDKLRFEYKHYPLPIHPYAQQAAIAAEAAGQQGKFFEYHDALFENQNEWTKSPTPVAFFTKYAQELGLDVEKFKQQQKSAFLRDAVRDDLNAARELSLTATPSFFLNGELMEITSFEDFISQIAFAIDPVAAQAALSASTSTSTPSADTGVKFGI
jgi:protein-disulfide isomerase